jgi:hypothetical protein
MAKKEKPELTMSKMPDESVKQYAAFQLYCETGSMGEMLKKWGTLKQKPDISGNFGDFSGIWAPDLGKPVTLRCVEMWCSRFQWVKRNEMKIEQELADLDAITKEYRRKRKYTIANLSQKMLKRFEADLDTSEEPTQARDVKLIWEMERTEFGESVGKTEHMVVTQRPLDEIEKELGLEVDSLIKSKIKGDSNASIKPRGAAAGA